MRARAHRTIPLALTGASLTFGACGDKTDGEVSDGDVAQAVENFANVLCKTIQRCAPDALEREFENLRGCVEYYKEYYTEYYTGLDDVREVEEPARCRSAIKKALDCSTRSYTHLSCDAFNGDDYISSDEDYTSSDDEEEPAPCEAEFDALDAACELEGDDEEEP